MEKKVTKRIEMDEARLTYRNFRGVVSEYNKGGERSFGLLLNDDLAEVLAGDGWHIKYKKPYPDDPEQYRQPYLQVKVRFDKYPPDIFLIMEDGSTIDITEENVGDLDFTSYKKCYIKVRPYNYPAIIGKPAGVSAYLEELAMVVDEERMASRSNSLRSKYERGELI